MSQAIQGRGSRKSKPTTHRALYKQLVSYDLDVRGGKAITARSWCERMVRLGAKVELDLEFELEAHTGWLPVVLEIVDVNLFEGAARFVGSRGGAGFEFAMQSFGEGADAGGIARRIAGVEEMLARFVELGSLDILVDDCRARIEAMRGGSAEQRVSFRSPGGRSALDFVAMTLAAFAYAIEAGATLEDPQRGEALSGEPLAAALAQRLAEGVAELDPA